MEMQNVGNLNRIVDNLKHNALRYYFFISFVKLRVTLKSEKYIVCNVFTVF